MKARELIPGWPRGRSTSSNVMYSRARYQAMGGPRIVWTIEEYAVVLDPRFADDVEAELAEEDRKAKMMRQYYADNLLETVRENKFIYERLCRILERPCHLPGKLNRLRDIL